MIHKTSVLGITFSSDTADNILKYLFETREKKEKKVFITTPNPEMIVYATRHPSFKSLLNDADIALCDGMGVFLAGKLLGSPIRERITGVDFIEMVCKESVNESKKDVRKPVVVGFLGGQKNVAKRTAECLRKKYPGLVVGFAGPEWPNINVRGPVSLHPRPTSALATAFNSSMQSEQIDILFVAYGFPKQEEWIVKNLPHIPVKAAMGVGGAFDYLSGDIIRAPFLLRAIGFEWLFRLIRQPWRIKRQTALLQFMLLVLKKRLQST